MNAEQRVSQINRTGGCAEIIHGKVFITKHVPLYIEGYSRPVGSHWVRVEIKPRSFRKGGQTFITY